MFGELFRKRLKNVFEIVVFVFLLTLANIRIFIFSNPRPYACIFDGMKSPLICQAGGAWGEIIVWGILGALFFFLLKKDDLLRFYLGAWKKNWLLIIFLGFAALSLLWTVFLAGSLHNISILILVSLIAAYTGVRYDTRRVLELLAWFIGVMVIANFALAIFIPDIGRANFHPYDGAWRGLFRNRNYLGSFMALGNLIFLLRLATSTRHQKVQIVISCIFYLFTLGLIALSRSATGLILFVVLNFVFLLGLVWLKWGHRLRAKHYYILGAFLFFGLVVLFEKLNFFLGFFNRDSTLTGRVDLWRYLLENWVSKRPILGHGYGAVWYGSLKMQAQNAVGWLYLIHIGDSGFMDILLNLGVVGLTILLLLLLLGSVCALIFAYQQWSVTDLFPLLVMIYVVLTNITLSYFMELEVFVWFLFVVALFLSTPTAKFTS